MHTIFLSIFACKYQRITTAQISTPNTETLYFNVIIACNSFRWWCAWQIHHDSLLLLGDLLQPQTFSRADCFYFEFRCFHFYFSSSFVPVGDVFNNTIYMHVLMIVTVTDFMLTPKSYQPRFEHTCTHYTSVYYIHMKECSIRSSGACHFTICDCVCE